MNTLTASSPQALPLAWPLSDMGSGDIWPRPSTNVYDAMQITLPGDDTCGLSAPGIQCSVPSGLSVGTLKRHTEDTEVCSGGVG